MSRDSHQIWKVNFFARLLRGLRGAVRTLEAAQLTSSNLGNGRRGQNMAAGQHLGRIVSCALFPGDRASKGAMEYELLAQL